MSIDMAQFHQVFFEESFENLEVMESGLLNLDMGDVNSEEINTIFRGAHSIKGGSGTFGFTGVSNFTHLMETLLDEMRDGRRKVTQSAVTVLLGAVDCLREMLVAIQNEQEVNANTVDAYRKSLEAELNHLNDSGVSELSPIGTSTPSSHNVETSVDQVQGWHIAFSPHLHLMKTGNDPVRIFRELSTLGELEVNVDLQGLPNIYNLDPEECYLSWELRVTGAIKFSDIESIFDWVEEDCDMAFQSFSDKKALANQQVQKDQVVETSATLNESPVTVTSLPSFSSPSVSALDEKPVEKVSEPAQKAPVVAEDQRAPTKGSSSIRVDTAKIDTLINMVGELVITQSMLSLIGEHFDLTKLDHLKNGLAQLERHTRELQESVMNIRMLPVSFVFSRFPRLTHDLSAKLGKKIELKLLGEHTEVDKTVVELISDPLVHLVRNSLDHGIELPDERRAAGKPEVGTVTLEAYHRGGNIVIEVRDDGRGLNKDKLKAKAIEKGLIDKDASLTDKQIYELIFMPGFSTAEQLTDISGRGVGMDVVRRNIQALGGNIEIISELGKGSTIAIHLPLTLAILDGQSVAVGNETYIVPLVSIIETINVTDKMLNRVAGKGETFRLRGDYLPIVRMHQIFDIKSARAKKLTEGLMVVVEGQGLRCGLFVDDLLGQQQVVIKSLEANYRRVEGISGATILGDGSVALILDIPGLVRLSNQ